MVAIGRSQLMYKTLEYLYSKAYDIEAVITDKSYKEYGVKSSDFRDLAESNGSLFFCTNNLESEEILEFFKGMKSNEGISVNWRYLIPDSVLTLFKWGVLNLHLGNLPDYKGNATPNWAILNGEPHIYINIHKMITSIDSGDIVDRQKIELSQDTYVGDILKKAEEVGPQLFYNSLTKLKENREFILVKNSPEGSRCYPRCEEDHQIDWNTSTNSILKLIRASATPYSGAYSYFRNQKIRFWRGEVSKRAFNYHAVPGQILLNEGGILYVACGDGVICLNELSGDKESEKLPEGLKSVKGRFRYRYE